MTSTSVRMMTYNIRLGIQQGLEAVSKVIRDQEPDIVALQEVGNHWIMGPEGDTTKILSELVELPYTYFVPALEDKHHPDAQYGHALLSRWPLTHIEVLFLPQNEDEPRALLFAEIEHPQKPFQILSTHLSWLESDRPEQADILVQHAAKAVAHKQNLIIAGDLNEHHDSAWIEKLQHIFQDADQKKCRLTYPSTAPEKRLDYLWSNFGQWQDINIRENAEASDHFPVAATLLLS